MIHDDHAATTCEHVACLPAKVQFPSLNVLSTNGRTAGSSLNVQTEARYNTYGHKASVSYYGIDSHHTHYRMVSIM